MTPTHRLHMPLATLLALVLMLMSALAASSAFAAGKPGGGPAIDPSKTCTEWPTRKTVVVLDPGHGGSDEGTGFDFNGDDIRDLLEKDVVLDISKQAAAILGGAGYDYTVCLTRIGDTGLGNSQRGEFANTVGASVFVMVHLNGSSDPTVNYTKTFWGKKSKDLAFSNHMYNVLLNGVRGFSGLGIPGGGVGQFANGALLSATMESTLTENVFLTNPKEAEALRDPNSLRRQQIATLLANGIDTWIDANP